MLTQQGDELHPAARSEPFFLYFAPVAPHLPAIPAPQDHGGSRTSRRCTRRRSTSANICDKPWRAWHQRSLKAAADLYHNQLARAPARVAARARPLVAPIVTRSRQRKLLDRTVIIYTSDNGFLWGEHRLGGKLWPYEESTHVPLSSARRGGRPRRGRDKPVLNIDLASTISRLAGVTPGMPQDGASFVPFLHGEHVAWRHDFVVEYLGENKLNVGGPPPYVARPHGRYLYVEYRRGWRELYDLERDPWELTNRARDPALAGRTAGGSGHRLHALARR